MESKSGSASLTNPTCSWHLEGRPPCGKPAHPVKVLGSLDPAWERWAWSTGATSTKTFSTRSRSKSISTDGPGCPKRLANGKNMRRRSPESGWADEQDGHDARLDASFGMRRWALFSNAVRNPSSLNHRVGGSVWMATSDRFRFGDDTLRNLIIHFPQRRFWIVMGSWTARSFQLGVRAGQVAITAAPIRPI
jgi:hypothetical protein